jgi:chemotaxis protein methyltransferase CheR
MNLEISDSELTLVREIIVSWFGLNFPVDRWGILRHRLGSAAEEFGFKDFPRFTQWLLSSELNIDHVKKLASHLTVGETYFWREEQVFNALAGSILPDIIGAKKMDEKSIRIWCAGCSTGEEPYSVAMALHRTIPKINEWDISILATDIDHTALAKAKTGIYREWSFRNAPDWLKTKYFHRVDNQKYEIIPEIKKMVTFSDFNLTNDNFLSTVCENNKIDIIFCRNVLMYFTDEWVTRITDNFFHSLKDEGWFFVSSCELSLLLNSQFKVVNFPGALLYRKGKNGSSRPLSVIDDENTGVINLPDTHNFMPYLPVEKSECLKVETDEFNPARMTDVIQSEGPSTLYHKLSAVEAQLIDSLPSEPTITDKIFNIRLLADKGFLSESLSLCNDTIALEKLSSGLYFLRASILQELDKVSEAINSLKKAIYIDPDYVIGHFTIGNLYTRQGNHKTANRYYKNVLDLLGRHTSNDILPESEGLSVNYLREMALFNMQKPDIN